MIPLHVTRSIIRSLPLAQNTPKKHNKYCRFMIKCSLHIWHLVKYIIKRRYHLPTRVAIKNKHTDYVLAGQHYHKLLVTDVHYSNSHTAVTFFVSRSFFRV